MTSTKDDISINMIYLNGQPVMTFEEFFERVTSLGDEVKRLREALAGTTSRIAMLESRVEEFEIA